MKQSPTIIVFLGKSGSGKGTQVELLSQKFGLEIVSSGALLRAKAQDTDFVGKRIKEIIESGGLIPTPVIFRLWMDKLSQFKESEDSLQGFIMEGSPRKVYEAHLLDEALGFFEWNECMKVIYLELSDQEAIQRLTKRGRNDDIEQAIQKRLDWYHKEVSPVVEYYREKGILVTINGEQDVDKVHQEVLEKLTGFLK
jgi:adenylate kinase